jgi:3-phosphoshikimate 1-carboxyvinyltransferase
VSAPLANVSFSVAPGAELQGELKVPGDKSISHRALLFGGLAEGITEVSGFLDGEDCLATLQALRALGVSIEQLPQQRLRIHGRGRGGLRAASDELDMGNAGTAMRLFMGVLAGQAFDSRLVGDSSLMRRPMERVAKPLRAMGARIDTLDGRPPVVIHGGQSLCGIDFRSPVSSAQIKSAVLLAGLQASGVTRVTEPAVSRDHTECMLASFGVSLQREALSVQLQGGQSLQATAIDVPGDFSSAAFLIVAGLLAAPQGLTIRNVGVNPTRTGLLDILRLMGAEIEVQRRDDGRGEPSADLHVRRCELRGVRVPESLVSLSIDEFPVLFIAAACASGETVVTGAGELRVKESDRLAVMAEGLLQLGVDCELLPDGMRIRGRATRAASGGTSFSGGSVNSHGDHRVAMSFAVASLRARGALQIADVANVATSFPGFPELMRGVGLPIALQTAT